MNVFNAKALYIKQVLTSKINIHNITVNISKYLIKKANKY